MWSGCERALPLALPPPRGYPARRAPRPPAMEAGSGSASVVMPMLPRGYSSANGMPAMRSARANASLAEFQGAASPWPGVRGRTRPASIPFEASRRSLGSQSEPNEGQRSPLSSSALFLVIPGTADSCSTVAARMPSSEPNAFISAWRRLGPMPGISSRVEVSADFVRRLRW